MKTYSYADIRKLRKGTKAYEEFDFPFLEEVRIAIRVLTQGEILECLDLGRNIAIEVLKRPRDIDAYQYGMVHLLAKSIYQLPENTGGDLTTPFFTSTDEVLELNKDEVEKLQEFYEVVQEKFSPTTKMETPEEFDAVIEEIKKNKIYGNSLSSLMLRKLVGYLILNSQKYQNDNGSGSSQGEPTKTNKKRKPLKEIEVQELSSEALK